MDEGDGTYPVNTEHLYNICTMLDQRPRRWADVVKMLYKLILTAWTIEDGLESIASRIN